MKALAIKEPYSSLIWDGKKTIETRTWQTSHRGDLLLTCCKQPESWLSGKAFAIVQLTNIERMDVTHIEGACCGVYPNAFAWKLNNIRRLEPFPVIGRLRLFEVEMPDEITWFEWRNDNETRY